MAPVVERLTDCMELGDAPHWDAATQSLYFVDVYAKALQRYIPARKYHTECSIGGEHVTFVLPIEGQENKFLISVGRFIFIADWDGETSRASNLTEIGEIEDTPETLTNRFNDAKCDATGRLWLGTMGDQPENGYVTPNKGSLYSTQDGKTFKKHLSPVSVSNGLAWTSDGKKFYYVDSPKKTIDEYEVDLESGTLKSTDGKPIFTLAKHDIPGYPDGLAIDTDGNLWVAIFDGYRVIKIDPRKPETLLQSIDIPTKQVTSVAFGGANLDELYVTTASYTVDDIELGSRDDGALFKITGIDAKGYPGVSFKM